MVKEAVSRNERNAGDLH